MLEQLLQQGKALLTAMARLEQRLTVIEARVANKRKAGDGEDDEDVNPSKSTKDD